MAVYFGRLYDIVAPLVGMQQPVRSWFPPLDEKISHEDSLAQ